jgi:hypothetical protein
MSLPSVRVVRSGSVSYPPPKDSFRERSARAFQPVLTLLGYMVALAPLTVVVLAAAAAIAAMHLNTGP